MVELFFSFPPDLEEGQVQHLMDISNRDKRRQPEVSDSKGTSESRAQGTPTLLGDSDMDEKANATAFREMFPQLQGHGDVWEAFNCTDVLDNHLHEGNGLVISRIQLAYLHQFPLRRKTVPQEQLQKFSRSREDGGNVKDSLEFATTVLGI